MSPYQKPATQHDLRQRLFTAIDKLSDRATFTQASNELDYLAKSLPSDHLPTFLSCILTVDSSTKSAVRVHCVNLISLLANTHSSTILSPHLPKIVTSVVKRLREADSAVRAACASAIAALSPHNFAYVVETLVQCVSTEQEVGAQAGGCLCLKAAVDAVDGTAVVVEDGGDDLRRRVLPKVVKLVKADGFKAKGALMAVMASLVGVNGGVVINFKGGGGLVGSVVGCAAEMLSSDDWAARKGGAEVLQVVADVVNLESAVEVKRFVVSTLESRRFDKVKGTRETMNRALEAWKEIPGGPDEVLALSRSNSSVSKDYGSGGGSPPLPRRSSFAGPEAAKLKKSMTKSRSSLSDGPTAFIPPSMSTSTQENVGRELPQRKHTLSKSRSSLSDDSTITDSSSVSKSSYDFGFETPQSKKQLSKTRSSLPDDSSIYKRSPSKTYDKKSSPYQTADSRKSSDWKVEIAVPAASSAKLESEDETESQDKNMEVTTSSSERSNFSRGSEERMQKSGYRYRTRVNPLVEEDEARRLDVGRRPYEEVGESTTDSAELSLIRNQLRQIERQQSDLLDLVQKFMGNSQNGIDSLETRVSGLEKALDVISHDLAVQTGRIPNNGSAGSTCCPSTEFLSPKFWRRTEGKSTYKPSYSGNVPNKDTSADVLQLDGHRGYEHNDGKCRDSWGRVDSNTSNVKAMSQATQRGRTCSPRSFDSPSTTPFITPGVRGA